MRGKLTAFALAAGALVGVVPIVDAAAAPPVLLGSSPYDGDYVTAVPDRVELVFDRQPDSLRASLALYSPGGGVSTASHFADRTMSATVEGTKPTENGVYRLNWVFEGASGNVLFTVLAPGQEVPAGSVGERSRAFESSLTIERDPWSSRLSVWPLLGGAIMLVGVGVWLSPVRRRKAG
ncbi:hypothetical protein GCM10022243_56470 [Saccharothrix violaceirubra]|uniref:Methionine-rich copper-binding protein CopC n=1 Tax=Saccharothrix violaceirubra TaxID=413306 RepID=A0A7W7WX78_9PSEU|nr:copper resistance protein CopC [Saccharothrix violaceirubra]MBB4967159.1 methionine-rich copper-binding protein CopC [Saccharothrix violaceirubra]